MACKKFFPSRQNTHLQSTSKVYCGRNKVQAKREERNGASEQPKCVASIGFRTLLISLQILGNCCRVESIHSVPYICYRYKKGKSHSECIMI